MTGGLRPFFTCKNDPFYWDKNYEGGMVPTSFKNKGYKNV